MAGKKKDPTSQIVADFIFENETPGALRFEELGPKEKQAVRKFYLRKANLPESPTGKFPTGLRLTVDLLYND